MINMKNLRVGSGPALVEHDDIGGLLENLHLHIPRPLLTQDLHDLIKQTERERNQ